MSVSAGEKVSFKKQQEDAAKKQNGELPPDLDEKGQMINPHNPSFLLKVPWYLGESGPTLKHQAAQKLDHDLSITEADRLFALKAQAHRQSQQQQQATKYRKGACKNCGAMTHKEKDCMERPRSTKRAAWKTGLDIASDEISLQLEQHGKVSYSTKRDAWQGYDNEEYKETIARFERIEEERKKQRAEERERQLLAEAEDKLKRRKEKKAAALEAKSKQLEVKVGEGDSGAASSSTAAAGGANDDTGDETGSASDSFSDTDSSDEDNDGGDIVGRKDDDTGVLLKDGDQRDFQSRKGGGQMKITQRNLRIREDTPKYLRNLDLNSAYYDPKSRSMRANPIPNANPEDLAFAGDNFVRYSGDALAMQATQVLCWEMQGRGESIDMISNPSQAEMVQRQFKEKKRELEESKRRAIMEKYGSAAGVVTVSGAAAMVGGDGPGAGAGAEAGAGGGGAAAMFDPRLRLGQTETYVEYSQDGRIIKGGLAVAPRSKYAEDVLEQNHLAVWGSYYSKTKRQWGYACCHSTIRGSYCMGAAGRQAEAAAEARERETMAALVARKKEAEASIAAASTESGKKNSISNRSLVYGETDANLVLDQDKMKEALRKAADWQQAKDGDGSGSQRLSDRPEGVTNKRGYHSMTTVEVSAEDMEAWRIKRLKEQDPMSALMGDTDILLEKE